MTLQCKELLRKIHFLIIFFTDIPIYCKCLQNQWIDLITMYNIFCPTFTDGTLLNLVVLYFILNGSESLTFTAICTQQKFCQTNCLSKITLMLCFPDYTYTVTSRGSLQQNRKTIRMAGEAHFYFDFMSLLLFCMFVYCSDFT